MDHTSWKVSVFKVYVVIRVNLSQLWPSFFDFCCLFFTLLLFCLERILFWDFLQYKSSQKINLSVVTLLFYHCYTAIEPHSPKRQEILTWWNTGVALPDMGGTIHTQSPGHPPRSLFCIVKVKKILCFNENSQNSLITFRFATSDSYSTKF